MEEEHEKGDAREVEEDDLQRWCRNEVDAESSRKETVQVLQDGKSVYSAVLTQTNLEKNSNKFYIVQLHMDVANEEYYVWHHWGRIGYKGKHMEKKCSLSEAREIFQQKFKEKTGNSWEEREHFVKKTNKYDLMKMQNNFEFAKMGEELKAIAKEDSKLEETVKELVFLLFDTEVMEKTMEDMGYNIKQSPLGKLTRDQVMDGYAALKEVELHMKNKTSEEALRQACDKYYTKIPHKVRMQQKPPLIKSPEQIETELELLESMDNIYAAKMILGAGERCTVDRLYDDLKCDIKRLDSKEEEFKMIKKYLEDTHDPEHNKYTMELQNVFKVTKTNLTFQDVGNRMLLWHGSRLTNWTGILSKGLRIAPPEAPSTGYMFGKGVYFADRSSKSCNYCKTSKNNNVGLVLLSEVALGESHELLAGNENADQLLDGKKSVKGLGRTIPDPGENYTMSCGTVVPLGKGIPTNQTRKGMELKFNEYVVYNTDQIKMRYLVKVKFNWK